MQLSAPGDALAMDMQAPTGAPARQEVTFADGSALWLHRIDGGGTFARRVSLPDGSDAAERVDLRKLAPELSFHLVPGASTRDVSTAIFHSLRKRFDSALAMQQSMGGLAA